MRGDPANESQEFAGRERLIQQRIHVQLHDTLSVVGGEKFTGQCQDLDLGELRTESGHQEQTIAAGQKGIDDGQVDVVSATVRHDFFGSTGFDNGITFLLHKPTEHAADGGVVFDEHDRGQWFGPCWVSHLLRPSEEVGKLALVFCRRLVVPRPM